MRPRFCRPPLFPGNQKDPNHAAWAGLWDWVDAPLRQAPQGRHPPAPMAAAAAAAPAPLAADMAAEAVPQSAAAGSAPGRHQTQPDELLQDPAQAIGGATAAAVAHLPPSATAAADERQSAPLNAMAHDPAASDSSNTGGRGRGDRTRVPFPRAWRPAQAAGPCAALGPQPAGQRWQRGYPGSAASCKQR